MRVSENEIEIRKETLDNYKVVRVERNEVTSFEKRLISECNIKFIPEMQSEKEGDTYCLLYKTTGLISVDTARKTGRLRADAIRVLFESLLKVYEMLPDYMLMPANIILTTDNVFFDMDLKTAYFIYVPGETYFEEVNKDVIAFAEDIINSVESMDTDTIMYIYTLICELKEENGTLKTAIKRADSLSFKTEDIPKVEIKPEADIFDVEEEETLKLPKKKKKKVAFGKAIIDFGKRKIGDCANVKPKKHDKYEDSIEFDDFIDEEESSDTFTENDAYSSETINLEGDGEILYLA